MKTPLTLSAIRKNFRNCLIIFILWELLCVDINGQEFSFAEKPDYRQIFGHCYDEALDFISDNSWMAESLKTAGIDPDFALAIVFPELIRYSSIQDKMEMSALLTLYVQYGEKYSDFSVGRFQMKPTFAAQLEKDTDKFKFNSLNTPEARTERVKRLDELQWQIKYLMLFLIVMDNKYHSYQWTNIENKLKFYATAYNSGYDLSEEKIRKDINRNMFHTGILKGGPCFNYANIALSFYSSRNQISF